MKVSVVILQFTTDVVGLTCGSSNSDVRSWRCYYDELNLGEL